MAFVPDHARSGLLATVLTTTLLWFGTGLHPWWPLLWLAPLPLLLLAGRASWRTTALSSGLSWFLGGLNLWPYYHGVLEIPAGIILGMLLTPALVITGAVLLFRALLRREAPLAALLGFPALWTSYEFLLSQVSPHGTAGNLAYTQLNCLPLLQVASLAGPWGITFLLLLFPTALAVGFQLWRTSRPRAIALAGFGLGLIVLALGFGALRLRQRPEGRTVKVGLLACDRPGFRGVPAPGEPSARVFDAYAREVAGLAYRGAQVIVLPEKLGVMLPPKETELDLLYQGLADRTGATLVLGLVHATAQGRANQARVYAPGAPVHPYDKQHLLPGFESGYRAGAERLVLSGHGATMGVAICKDMDFEEPSRQYGQAGVGLMLVPGWDFGVDRWAHGHMAVMGGVACGFSVARAAKEGYLTISDDRGRVLGEARSEAEPFATLLVEVPVAHDATPFLRWGDWFAWLSVVVLGLALLGGSAFRWSR